MLDTRPILDVCERIVLRLIFSEHKFFTRHPVSRLPAPSRASPTGRRNTPDKIVRAAYERRNENAQPPSTFLSFTSQRRNKRARLRARRRYKYRIVNTRADKRRAKERKNTRGEKRTVRREQKGEKGKAERENFGYNKIQISARTNSPCCGI